jgi:hypothetical protein
MDYSFQGRHPPTHLAAMVAQNNAVVEDQQWVADSGANTHITNELDNLTLQQPFQSDETVTVGNDAGLAMENFGSSILISANSKFHLKDVLYRPQATANLLSIQKFCKDNDCYFKLTSTHFYVKDTRTSALLLEGRCENGFYLLRFHKTSLQGKCALATSFTAFIGIKTSSLGWHLRLGHPSSEVVARVIKHFDLPMSVNDFNKDFVCVPCQLGKCKRQPFSPSSRISSHPLDLIHTDV